MANLPLIRANLCPLTYLDVPERAYTRAMLGVYEITRIELLRDLYVWAYERSTHEYLALKQDLAEPDPVRLAYREVIKRTIQNVVKTAEDDALGAIHRDVTKHVTDADRQNVRALVIDEIRRLHAGSLSRYGLRPTEFARWRERLRTSSEGG